MSTIVDGPLKIEITSSVRRTASTTGFFHFPMWDVLAPRHCQHGVNGIALVSKQQEVDSSPESSIDSLVL